MVDELVMIADAYDGLIRDEIKRAREMEEARFGR